MPSDAHSSDGAAAGVSPPSISVVGVRKHFGVTRALDGCNFSARFGEIHAIVGGNGCGKSTLAKILSGVLPADSGRVSVLGRSTLTPYEARDIGVATVFQEVLVADECSVVDNLFMGADGLFTQRMSSAAKLRAADTLMQDLAGERLDVQALAGSLPLNLKQWITIGRALLRNPRILILDESSAALDLDSTERLFAKMRALRDAGATVLIVTHRIAELIRISDRATVLRDGRDVGVLERSEITEQNLLSLMTGRSDHAKPVSSIAAEDALQGDVVLKTRGLRIWPGSPPIDFDLHRGEILGVAGLDGQGQSEFVRILAGVQAAAAGHPEVRKGDGRFAAIRSLAEATAEGVSYVSGDRKREGIFANLSIFENMLLPLYRLKARAGAIATIDWRALEGTFAYEVDNLLIKMGSRNNKITSLSGGNQQKILIARAFAEKPIILVLNDPARGIDIGAKFDLYRNLRDFAARGAAVVFLSSEVEEFLNLCTRVHVFRNGAIAFSFEPPYDSHVLLNAMFGRRLGAALGDEAAKDNAATGAESETTDPPPLRASIEGRPMPRPVTAAKPQSNEADMAELFQLRAPDIAPGATIPSRYVEDSLISPRLVWSGVPNGTRSFALSITDPDLPAEFNFPRSFAHWLILNIPSSVHGLPEGASRSGLMPPGSVELNSDYVTFKIPGFGAGYGGPWPPDRAHRYIFTVYALTTDRIDLGAGADLPAFSTAVLPVTLGSATFTAVYGPATKPLPG